jgi:CRISPR/Cas system CMR-associated protein Cmr3 (group 5 of RAMP superfamily)
LPRYDIPYEYVLFKPLSRTDSDENIRAVIFPVSPIELAGLVTLAGSVMPGTDPVQVPQGADCNSITAFAYAQADLDAPRAVMGMLGVDGREVMQKRFRDDTLTLTLPIPLYQRMEEEAYDCVFQIPSWKRLVEH